IALWKGVICIGNVFFILISRELKNRSYAKDDGDSVTYEDHVKKDCPKWNKQKSTSFVKKNVGPGYRMHSDGNDNGDLLMAVSKEMFLESSMDYGGSYHMTPTKDIFFNYKEFNSCTILLSDNRACAIGGREGESTNEILFKFVLKNVRYIPELKRNLIYLGTLDRERYTVDM
ncbi:hypothetical protein Tco_1035512, partial [Tanacetum coccineum]